MNFEEFLLEISDLYCIRKYDTKEYKICFVDFKDLETGANVYEMKGELVEKLHIINDDFTSVYDLMISNLLNLGMDSLNKLDNESKERFTKKIVEDDSVYDRKFISKINFASNSIAINGYIGPAQYVIGNSKNNEILKRYSDLSKFMKIKIHDGIIKDDEIIVGRKNEPDQPGVCFIFYIENNFVYYDIINIGLSPSKQYLCFNF